jgi:DNA polymerase-3 subunit gamma/tau
MPYTVLARRYRSRTFDEVVGQDAITQTLKSAIEHDRVAHAYLFCGTRGVGKTTVARILARALNCEKGPTPEPCGTCDVCQSIHRGDDVDVLEIDGASNTGVEDVRALRENAHYRPARARFKIYYIDEVHMLSRSAFNALLKILEEPPAHVKFIFSTTEPERMPATVLSRCQRFDFRAVPTDVIAEHITFICQQEKAKADAEAVRAIAREGRGSVRDALTLLDQALAVGDGKVTLEAVRQTVGAVRGEEVLAIIDACVRGDTGAALERFAGLLASGADLGSMLEQLMRQVRDLLVVKTCGQEAELLDAFGPDRHRLAEVAEPVAVAGLVACLGYLTEARSRARFAVDPRPVAELAIVRMASLAEMEPLPEVLAHLETLERSLAGTAAAPAPDEKKKRPAPPVNVPEPAAAQASDSRRSRGPPPQEPQQEVGQEARGPAPAKVPQPRRADRPQAPAQRPAAAPAGADADDEVVRKALDIFDGRLWGR